jgi:hypothetical protein
MLSQRAKRIALCPCIYSLTEEVDVTAEITLIIISIKLSNT